MKNSLYLIQHCHNIIPVLQIDLANCWWFCSRKPYYIFPHEESVLNKSTLAKLNLCMCLCKSPPGHTCSNNFPPLRPECLDNLAPKLPGGSRDKDNSLRRISLSHSYSSCCILYIFFQLGEEVTVIDAKKFLIAGLVMKSHTIQSWIISPHKAT